MGIGLWSHNAAARHLLQARELDPLLCCLAQQCLHQPLHLGIARAWGMTIETVRSAVGTIGPVERPWGLPPGPPTTGI
jgi:hypothetical protein